MSLQLDSSSLGLHVVLVEPEVPPNTGNIARLCVGVGATLHLVGRLGFSTDDATLKRAGLDYWKHLSVEYHAGLEDVGKDARPDRFHYLTTRAERSYTEARYRPGDYLVFGSESTGLSDAVLKNAGDRLITIPMTDRVRSINLSNAVAVVVYEAVRQLTYGHGRKSVAPGNPVNGGRMGG